MSDLAIRVDNAVKTFAPQPHSPLTRLAAGSAARPVSPRPTVAVDHVSFDVRRGEIFGVVGPNGSGKTVAQRLCDRVAIVDSGRLVALDAPATLKQRLAPQPGGTLEDVFLTLTRRPAPVAEEPV